MLRLHHTKGFQNFLWIPISKKLASHGPTHVSHGIMFERETRLKQRVTLTGHSSCSHEWEDYFLSIVSILPRKSQCYRTTSVQKIPWLDFNFHRREESYRRKLKFSLLRKINSFFLELFSYLLWYLLITQMRHKCLTQEGDY